MHDRSVALEYLAMLDVPRVLRLYGTPVSRFRHRNSAEFRRCGSTTDASRYPRRVRTPVRGAFQTPFDESWRCGPLSRQNTVAERTCTRGEALQPGDRLEH